MKNKLVTFILVLSLSVIILPVYAQDTLQESKASLISISESNIGILRTADTYIVNADGVRVRSDYSTSSSVNGLLYKGDWVEVGDETYSGSGYTWKYVISSSRGIRGYIVTDYLTHETE